MRADLHLHTNHSDGVRPPKDVVDLAKQHGFDLIALSDHDNNAAYYEIADYTAASGMKLLTSVELSVDYGEEDVHMLAYGFAADSQEVADALEKFRQRRLNRGLAMVDRLIELGYPITYERVDEIRGHAALGRPHIAHALIEAKVVASVDEAFDTLLAPGKPGYVDRPRMKAKDAIDMIHRAGGVTSIAHPTLNKGGDAIIEALIDMGLDGIEAFHPDVPEADRNRYLQMARARNLLITGGSDDHGFEGAMTIGTAWLDEPYVGRLLERLR